jgi:hypothetical protein
MKINSNEDAQNWVLGRRQEATHSLKRTFPVGQGPEK